LSVKVIDERGWVGVPLRIGLRTLRNKSLTD
jgi:hypothetical protein